MSVTLNNQGIISRCPRKENIQKVKRKHNKFKRDNLQSIARIRERPRFFLYERSEIKNFNKFSSCFLLGYISWLGKADISSSHTTPNNMSV